MARDIFSKEPDQPKHSGEDIHAVIDGVHNDYEKAKKSRRGYRRDDLLS